MMHVFVDLHEQRPGPVDDARPRREETPDAVALHAAARVQLRELLAAKLGARSIRRRRYELLPLLCSSSWTGWSEVKPNNTEELLL